MTDETNLVDVFVESFMREAGDFATIFDRFDGMRPGEVVDGDILQGCRYLCRFKFKSTGFVFKVTLWQNASKRYEYFVGTEGVPGRGASHSVSVQSKVFPVKTGNELRGLSLRDRLVPGLVKRLCEVAA